MVRQACLSPFKKMKILNKAQQAGTMERKDPVKKE